MTPMLLALACAEPGPVVFTRARVDGAVVELRVEAGRFTGVGATVDHGDARIVDLGGAHVVPGFVDAHVHLAYRPDPDGMLDGGVVATVDWAAPLDRMAAPDPDLQWRASGPILAPVGGYPTQSWGSDGYGLETRPEDVEAAVDRLAEAGATVIKVALQGAPSWDSDTLERIVARARTRGLEVGVHALGAADAQLACAAGATILVHTPVEPLPDAAVRACSRVTVISTLTAFGGSDATLQNLRRLRAAGATIVYGTDFGNTSTAGIQIRELEALQAAGLDGAAILAAGTTTPAARFGFEVGIAPGLPASFLVLAADPRERPTTLADPSQVWVAGERRR